MRAAAARYGLLEIGSFYSLFDLKSEEKKELSIIARNIDKARSVA